MNQKVAFQHLHCSLVVDDGGSNAVQHIIACDAAFDACLGEDGVVDGGDLIADAVAVG